MNPLLLAGLLLVQGASVDSASLKRESIRAVGLGDLESISTLTPRQTPRLVLIGAPSPELVVLRLSVPVRERWDEAGYGHVLQALAAERARPFVDRIGARFVVGRSPWALSYTVAGAAADADYLLRILREAAGPPRPEPLRLRRAREGLLASSEQARETGMGFVAAELSAQICPGDAPREGTAASLASLSPGRLRAFWERTHGPESVSVVASASLPRVVLLAGMSPLGRSGPPPAPVSEEDGLGANREASADTGERPELLRWWIGRAYRVRPEEALLAEVTALLLVDFLGMAPQGFEGHVSLIRDRCSLGLLVVGGAYPANQADLRRRIEAALANLGTSLDEEAVARAHTSVLREELTTLATPIGTVNRLGEALDRGDPAEPAAADGADPAPVSGMAPVTITELRAFLARLIADRPLSVEVRP